jgi:4-hydroxybenzoate polyprenyltransferase
MAGDRSPSQQQVERTTAAGLIAMTAMMAVCCVAVLALVLLIPLLGWPAGIITAVAVGGALMYAHMKFMSHSGHH